MDGEEEDPFTALMIIAQDQQRRFHREAGD